MIYSIYINEFYLIFVKSCILDERLHEQAFIHGMEAVLTSNDFVELCLTQAQILRILIYCFSNHQLYSKNLSNLYPKNLQT